jgi:hypothetical protein
LRLQVFLAQGNRFDGTIPDELFDNIDVKTLRLDDNNFIGTLSMSVGDLSIVDELRLNNNKMTGTLPITLWRLTQLGTCTGCSRLVGLAVYLLTLYIFM